MELKEQRTATERVGFRVLLILNGIESFFKAPLCFIAIWIQLILNGIESGGIRRVY